MSEYKPILLALGVFVAVVGIIFFAVFGEGGPSKGKQPSAG